MTKRKAYVNLNHEYSERYMDDWLGAEDIKRFFWRMNADRYVLTMALFIITIPILTFLAPAATAAILIVGGLTFMTVFLPNRDMILDDENDKVVRSLGQGRSFNHVYDKHWKKWAAMAFLVLIMIPNAQAANIYRDPSVINITLSVTRDAPTATLEQKLTLVNNEIDIIDNAALVSPYILDYSPREKNLVPGEERNFTITFFIENVTENQSIVTQINVTGEIEGESQLLTDIPLIVNLRADYEPLRDYLYRKCFIEEGEEFCTMINITDLQNVTLYNITQKNVSLDVLMPLETLKQYLEKYDSKLELTTAEVKRIVDDLLITTNETRNAQEREKNKYINSGKIETYLKNEKNPLWFEISPRNVLIENVSGLSLQEFSDAMTVLFSQGKVIQEQIEETETQVKDDVIVQRKIKKTMIASTERVKTANTEAAAAGTVLFAGFFIFIAVAAIMTYEMRLKSNPRWKK